MPSASKKTKKKSTQPVKRARKSPPAMGRKPWRLALWLLAGLLIGLGVPWLLYLNHLVKTQFVHHRWHSPSQVYAAPLSAFEGKVLSPDRLLYHLQLLGYRAVAHTPGLGEYRHRSSGADEQFTIHTRGFRLPEGRLDAQRVSLHLGRNDAGQWTVNTLRGAEVLTLEPVRLGGFYSADLEQRQPVKLTHLPVTLVQGIQAVEDRQFNHHHGINLAGMARAAWRNLLAGRVVQGGSTITQQLVKNRLRMPQRSWSRKINEIALALLLERQRDKGDILQDYLNEVYWGQAGILAIHGIAQAARYYFGKSPPQLDLAEQALLIGLIKGPSWYNPRKHPQRALQRRNLVLKLMADTGIISDSARKQAASQPLGVTPKGQVDAGGYGDFMQLVRQRLRQRFKPEQLQQAGLRIFTTLDPWAQKQLSGSLASVVPRLGQSLQGAAVLTQAKSGEVLALDGGIERFSGFNRALLMRRQIGSLIKPFIYLAGLELLPDFSLDSPLADEPVAIRTRRGEHWRPANFSHRSHGTVAARDALLHSWNLATVHLGQRIGLKRLAGFLNRLGLHTPARLHPSLLLGAIELSPLETSQLYQWLASQGSQNEIVALRAVTDDQGTLLLRPRTATPPAVNPEHMQQILAVLRHITTDGTAATLRNWPHLLRPLFGKTGTTNGGRDNWFAGFDRRYLLTVWVGRDDNKPTGLTGARAALPVWADALQKLQETR